MISLEIVFKIIFQIIFLKVSTHVDLRRLNFWETIFEKSFEASNTLNRVDLTRVLSLLTDSCDADIVEVDGDRCDLKDELNIEQLFVLRRLVDGIVDHIGWVEVFQSRFHADDVFGRMEQKVSVEVFHDDEIVTGVDVLNLIEDLCVELVLSAKLVSVPLV